MLQPHNHNAPFCLIRFFDVVSSRWNIDETCCSSLTKRVFRKRYCNDIRACQNKIGAHFISLLFESDSLLKNGHGLHLQPRFILSNFHQRLQLNNTSQVFKDIQYSFPLMTTSTHQSPASPFVFANKEPSHPLLARIFILQQQQEKRQNIILWIYC